MKDLIKRIQSSSFDINKPSNVLNIINEYFLKYSIEDPNVKGSYYIVVNGLLLFIKEIFSTYNIQNYTELRYDSDFLYWLMNAPNITNADQLLVIFHVLEQNNLLNYRMIFLTETNLNLNLLLKDEFERVSLCNEPTISNNGMIVVRFLET